VNTIFFIRHGENWANITREFSYKKVDYSLTPKGILQAKKTAKHLLTLEIDALYCSPLKRAVETAHIIALTLHRPMTPLEQFREINVGTLEDGLPLAENWRLHDSIVADWQQGKTEVAFPGGENYGRLLQRMQAGLCTMMEGKTESKIAVVGHAGILAATIQDICPHVVGKSVTHAPLENCSITRIEMDICQNIPVGILITWADTAHLT
jgi:2,3-bisphosphoglycerate-dependent phosphoglycerate mutase